MKVLLIGLILLLSAEARHGGGFGGMRGGGFRGGGGHPGYVRGGYHRGPGGYVGGYRGGFIGGGYRYGNYWRHGSFGRFGYGFRSYPYRSFYGYGAYAPIFPAYYPFFGYNYSSPALYSQPYDASPNVVVVMAPPQQTTPQVVVYDSPARSVQRESSEAAPSSTTESEKPREFRSVIYLIALNDGSIRAAEAYWVEGNTLHYITRQHERKQVPLDQVDRQFSIQLNSERRVEFRLP